jgi:hypothetical protein|nr:MAG TPA_asm: hypothetical protein [Caudoviricetes sp.]
METNKETRMISSDEIFYAVLKDGTIVNNVKSLLTIDKQDKLQSAFVKLLTADTDILKDIESYTNSEKTVFLVTLPIARFLSCKTKEKILDKLISSL